MLTETQFLPPPDKLPAFNIPADQYIALFRKTAEPAESLRSQIPEFDSVLKSVEQNQDQFTSIKAQAVDVVLVQDPEHGRRIKDLRYLDSDLRSLITWLQKPETDIEKVKPEVNRLLREYEQTFNTLHGQENRSQHRTVTTPANDILRHSRTKGDLIQALRKYAGKSGDPETHWQLLVDEHIVSPELFEEMDRVSLLFETNSALRMIAESDLSPEQQKIARAWLGKRVIERCSDAGTKGLMAELMHDAVIDSETFAPDFAANLLANYLNITAAIADQRSDGPKFRFTKKSAVRIAQVMLATSMLTASVPIHPPYPGPEKTANSPAGPNVTSKPPVLKEEKDIANSVDLSDTTNITEDILDLSPDARDERNTTLGDWEEVDQGESGTEGKPGEGDGGGGSGTGEADQGGSEEGGTGEGDSNGEADREGEYGVSAGQEGSPEAEQPSSKNPDEVIVPRNDRVESVEAAKKTVIWELEGNIPDGYYRTATASEFDYTKMGWKVNGEVDRIVIPGLNSQPVFYENSSVTLTGKQSQNIELAIPYGYTPDITHSSVTYNGKNVNFKIFFNRDGTFSLVLQDYPQNLISGVEAQLHVAVAKIDLENQYDLSPNNGDYSQVGIDVSNLPQDVQDMYDQASSIQDAKEQAEFIAKFIRDKFTYSLNPLYSDYYHATDSPYGFFRRIFKVRKTDCDVANTALLALLRQQGVISRMAYGFDNQGSGISFFGDEKDALTRMEAHGWVEIYYKGKWIPIDATPTNMDNYTKKKFQEGEQQQESAPIPKTPEELKDWSYQQMLRGKESLGLFGEKLVYGDSEAQNLFINWAALYGLTQLGFWVWGGINRLKYEGKLKRFQITLKAKIAGRSDGYYEQNAQVVTDLTDHMLPKGRLSKWLKAISNLTVVTVPAVLTRETVRVRQFGQRVDETMAESGQIPSLPDAIAQISGKEVERVIKNMESKNTDHMQFEIKAGSESALNREIREGNHFDERIKPPYVYGAKVDRIAKKAKSFEQFYYGVCRDYYRRMLRTEFPRSFIWERRQAIGGFRGFLDNLPEEFQRGMVMYWKIHQPGKIT